MTKIKTKKREAQHEGTFLYEEFEKEAIGRLRKGGGLVGADGVLTGLIQRIVNAALSGEVDGHIRQGKAGGQANRRNGHTSKTLDTELGPVPISPPRDRAGSFEPQLVGKCSPTPSSCGKSGAPAIRSTLSTHGFSSASFAKKIADNPNQPKLILTESGVGYRFVGINSSAL